MIYLHALIMSNQIHILNNILIMNHDSGTYILYSHRVCQPSTEKSNIVLSTTP